MTVEKDLESGKIDSCIKSVVAIASAARILQNPQFTENAFAYIALRPYNVWFQSISKMLLTIEVGVTILPRIIGLLSIP
jgi:hypothetical protein